jgi:hypothetical protein
MLPRPQDPHLGLAPGVSVIASPVSAESNGSRALPFLGRLRSIQSDVANYVRGNDFHFRGQVDLSLPVVTSLFISGLLANVVFIVKIASEGNHHSFFTI